MPVGVFPCADGYVAIMSTAQQLGAMLQVLDDPHVEAAFSELSAFDRPETKEILDVALYQWLVARTRQRATAEAQEAGWPLAGLVTPIELLQADHLHQRSFWIHTDDPVRGSVDLPGPWCRFAEGGWRLGRLTPSPGEHSAEIAVSPWRTDGIRDETRLTGPGSAATQVSAPLDGIRVVDLTVVWSGPYATMLLADLGAEVIRVENPYVLPPTTKGYHPRPVLTNPGMLGSLYAPPQPGAPDRPWNRHAMNNSLARNKLSVTVDIRRPEGKELLMRLAERSDVWIDNFKANGLDRLGIEVSALMRRNPRLIIVRLPPTGTTGDWSRYTGFGAQFDAMSGLLSLHGHPHLDPTETPATTYMDAATGPAGAFAVMAALRYRESTGRGQLIELSQSENVINHLGDILVDAQLGIVPARCGNRDRRRAPQGLYPCRDPGEWLAVVVADSHQWQALAKTLGRADLASDSRFDELSGRLTNHDELDEAIRKWTSCRPMMEAFHSLQAAGIPAGPLLSDADFSADPHVEARRWLRTLCSQDVGEHLHPGLAFRGVPQVWRRGSPTLGEDNEYVYKQVLGLSDEDYDRFEREKLLSTDYLLADGTPY
jgi:crotonobetainyl-CoA:carnitine CoA-transferase CaiB-like acyl-CoA transferase